MTDERMMQASFYAVSESIAIAARRATGDTATRLGALSALLKMISGESPETRRDAWGEMRKNYQAEIATLTGDAAAACKSMDMVLGFEPRPLDVPE